MPFGIEFEMNIVDTKNITSDYLSGQHGPVNSGWGVQADGTTAVELNSPPYLTLKEASDSIAKQFKKWIEYNSVAPYSYNANNHSREELTSSGQHIHVAKTMDAEDMSTSHKIRFVEHVRIIYPFLMAISAQPVPSKRMLTSCFCNSLSHNSDYMPDDNNDHEQEINYSHLGTVEFRVFDTNIPQCSLTEAWILTNICNHTSNRAYHKDAEEFDENTYDRLRNLACRHGFSGLPITRMLTNTKEMMLPHLNSEDNADLNKAIVSETVDNFQVDSVRDILYMATKYNLNPSDIYHILKPNKFEYFSTMFFNPDKYLENLVNITSNLKTKTILSKWLEDSKAVKGFDNLIALSVDKPEKYKIPDIKQKRVITPMTKETVVSKLNNNEYDIKRIKEVIGMTKYDVAEDLAKIINIDENIYINHIDSRNILRSPDRHYVLYIKDTETNIPTILGTIGYNVSNKALTTLAVNKDYRQIGIATKLVNYILDIAQNNYISLITYVKKGNTIAEHLFSKQFILKEKTEDYKVYSFEQ